MNKEVSEERTSEIVREFFLGEFSFEELKYVPANHSKGDNKELADLIIDYGDKTIAWKTVSKTMFLAKQYIHL